jgi:2-oxoglutarate ferredoxin oxidoreductase subunit gamma
MIILGAFLAKRPLVSAKSIMKGLSKVLPERNHHLLPINEKALKHGMGLIK